MADPIQGLIDFVLAQKPYHTKILDTLVNYVHEDEVDIEFTETQLFEIGQIIEAELSDDSGTPESVVQTCPLGFGDTWDQQGQFLVIWVDTVPANNVVYVKGDQTASFTPSVTFEVRNPDPTFQTTTPLTVVSSAYDGPTDRTAITISGAFPAIPWTIPGAAPGTNVDTAGDVFIIYTVVSTTIIGNIIVVNGVGINIDDFQPGFAVDIRNAAEPALNQQYRVVASVETGVNEITIFSTTNVLADTVADGELVFSGFGYDEPPFCASSEDTLVQPVIAETLDIHTEGYPFAIGVDSFQHFILEADSGADTFIVFGDARLDLPPAAVVDVIHAVDNWATVVTVPTINGAELNYGFGATLSNNDSTINGSYTVVSSAFDPITNRTTVVMDNVPVSTRTGWIIPT